MNTPAGVPEGKIRTSSVMVRLPGNTDVNQPGGPTGHSTTQTSSLRRDTRPLQRDDQLEESDSDDDDDVDADHNEHDDQIAASTARATYLHTIYGTMMGQPIYGQTQEGGHLDENYS